MAGTLFVIATPIGNLADLSERAKDALASVDAVLCEDTRVTAKLMAAIDAKRPLVAIHQHTDERKMREAVERLRAGENLALVTDAGTPGISDPGGKLVELASRELPEAPIVPIPGPSALITALSASGFPADKFLFLGFPPQKKGRKAYFARVADSRETVAFYESTHRIGKTLVELGDAIGERPVMVARELTKMHETLYRGNCEAVSEQLLSGSIKGEFVIVVRAL